MYDVLTGTLAATTLGILLFARWRMAPPIVFFVLLLAAGLSMALGFFKIQLVGGLIFGSVMACFVVGLCRGSARECVLGTLAVLCLVVGLCACQPSASVNTTGDKPVVSTALAAVEQVETFVASIKWIIPFAQGAIAIFAPGLAPTLAMAVASYNALTATADSLIATYRGDPASVDATKFTSLLTDLKNAWQVLDGVYKADTTALEAATTS